MVSQKIKICISGLTGSGKTTLGTIISKELGILHITKAQTQTYSEIENRLKEKPNRALSIGQSATPKYAKLFDSEIVKAASKHNCVVTTWLGPWMIKDATLRIWLNASFEERARRKANDMRISLKKAKAYVLEKDFYAIKQFRRIYGIDIIHDHNIFDLEINTEKLDHTKVAAVVSMLSLLKDSRRF
ncbi:MAG: cytidylate kinase family protein [Candidatus Micrarchaeaceae archaeon]